MKKLFYLLLVLNTFHLAAIGQTPNIEPTPGSRTWCPGEMIDYEVITSGAQQTKCKYVWSVTNGSFYNGINNTRKVTVIWNDIAGTGKLTVTLSECTEATNTTVSESYAIRSLKDKTLANPQALQSLPYCSVTPIQVQVDEMLLENTGGTTGIPQQRADGYEWTLPTGWKSNGVAGTVRSTTRYITITPDNGCAGGSVSVKAYISSCSSGYKYSASATISVDRVGFNSSLSTPSGYTGPRCGVTSPVTFTAASFPCAVSYRWTYPFSTLNNRGWIGPGGATGVYTTTTNTITLTPTGTPDDQGVISVDINLGCKIITQTYLANYSDPPLANPVFNSSSTNLMCSNGTGSVSISAIPEAASYTWHATGPGSYPILINGTYFTTSSPLTTTSTSVTLTAPTYSQPEGFQGNIVVKANRTAGCLGSNAVPLGVWVGKPKQVYRITEDRGGSPPFSLCTSTAYGFTADDRYNLYGTLTYTWLKPSGATITSGQGTTYAIIKMPSTTASGYVSVRASNTCGSGPLKDAQVDIQSCTGPRSAGTTIFPNPADEQVTINLESQNTTGYSIVLFDDQMNKVVDKSRLEKKSELTTKHLKNGLYVLNVIHPDGSREIFQLIIKH